MKLKPLVTLLTPLLLAIIYVSSAGADDDRPYGLRNRIPWTASRVTGSPDPPLPYKVEPVFTHVKWDRPIYAKAEPHTNGLLVIQQGGERDRPSTIVRLADDNSATGVEQVLEMKGRLVYGLEFHPHYAENGFLFVFSNGPTGSDERLNRISRFVVSSSAPRVCDPSSERIVLEWRSMGHDGGDLVFGHDGMLYIASGDGTADSDRWFSAQDVSNLLGAILRIDVDREDGDRPYAIPADNPFLNVERARGEIWAFGLRNPWRMSIDTKTGMIWVGNNGQNLWETAHLVRRGDNYGWSVYEGNHPFYLHRQMGPAAFVPPTIEHHHSEARSLTGGVVYHGDRLENLEGAYVYGDYSTGKIWGARHDGRRIIWQRELADTTLQIAGFALSQHGDLLVIDHGGGLNRLIVNEPTDRPSAFPVRLSETGVFRSVKGHRIEPGVIPYSVNAPAWNDGAVVERFLALPDDLQIEYTSSKGWNFPDGTVLIQTLSLVDDSPDSGSLRRVESRLLTRQQGEWAGYSYRWNEQQDDATLVRRQGDDALIELKVEHRRVSQKWRFPSRAECMSCHSRAANFVLGICEAQMNRDHRYDAAFDNQLRSFAHIGLFRQKLPNAATELPRLVDPYDRSQDLDARARSYLHANCSSCHVEAGGGNSRMDLEFSKSLKDMNLVATHPQHDTFGLDRPLLVSPGDPERSVLYQRINRRGRGQMPPLVSQRVDETAIELFREWISQLEPVRKFVKDWTVEELNRLTRAGLENRSFDAGRNSFRVAGCAQCHRFHHEGGGAGPDLTGIGSRRQLHELVESIVLPSKQIAAEYATTVLIMADGRTLQGRIEAETDEDIVLRSDVSFAQPERVDKGDIEDRFLSERSIMPQGTLNTLEESEVLDLISYLLADGDRKHAAFAPSTGDVGE